MFMQEAGCKCIAPASKTILYWISSCRGSSLIRKPPVSFKMGGLARDHPPPAMTVSHLTCSARGSRHDGDISSVLSHVLCLIYCGDVHLRQGERVILPPSSMIMLAGSS